jgi:hypothetical protein
VADHDGDSARWYQRYVDVLVNIGWVIETNVVTQRDVSGHNLSVHEEIIPVVTAALGPVAASASVIALLKGLANMNKDLPWITLFERESQRVSANQFQISYTKIENGTPRITLVGFELDASGSVTQVLFFKFGASHASLKHRDIKIAVNATLFGQVADTIAARVKTFVTQYIADIKI